MNKNLSLKALTLSIFASMLLSGIIGTVVIAGDAKNTEKAHQHENHNHAAKTEKVEKKQAGNHHQGQALHNDKCTKCHQDDVYTRKDRTVKTLAALQSQVNNCMKGAARADWDNAQTSSVVNFLNDRYYKF
ncbi:MAG TPA: hypothetical protein ENJ08_19655 [Gammaproteobacteria bacterium]|nr:hypothetical protein [Gammaproteobacteria bacterium]